MNAWKNVLLPALSLVVMAFSPVGAAHAQVKVTAATPSSTVQGTVNLDVIVSGSGFDSTSSAQFFVTGTTNPGGITVRKTTFRNTKEVVATIDVADMAEIASFDIQVTLSSGRKGKGTTLFSVQAKKLPPPDPCVSPSLVTEATFPSFMFGQTVELARNVYGTGIFLADASGKCTRMIGTWDSGRSTIGDFRYDANRDQAMILAPGPGGFVAMTSMIGFGLNGPTASTIGTPIFLLDPAALPLPADLAAADWYVYGYEQFALSPDATQVVLNQSYRSSGQVSHMVESVWVCSVTYDAGGVIQPIMPSSCSEVHRGPVDPRRLQTVVWGALPGTLYVSGPASADPLRMSLYRLTLQPAPARAIAAEIFNSGADFSHFKATAVATGPNASNGELAAVGQVGANGCDTVVVIDAYNCSGLGCRVLNQKGMRNVTWLPDGRLAGRDQTPPSRRNSGQCLPIDQLVAYPAVDSSNTPPTLLLQTPTIPYRSCFGCMEGARGGW
jgi:hypothetical protein